MNQNKTTNPLTKQQKTTILTHPGVGVNKDLLNLIKKTTKTTQTREEIIQKSTLLLWHLLGHTNDTTEREKYTEFKKTIESYFNPTTPAEDIQNRINTIASKIEYLQKENKHPQINEAITFLIEKKILNSILSDKNKPIKLKTGIIKGLAHITDAETRNKLYTKIEKEIEDILYTPETSENFTSIAEAINKIKDKEVALSLIEHTDLPTIIKDQKKSQDLKNFIAYGLNKLKKTVAIELIKEHTIEDILQQDKAVFFAHNSEKYIPKTPAFKILQTPIKDLPGAKKISSGKTIEQGKETRNHQTEGIINDLQIMLREKGFIAQENNTLLIKLAEYIKEKQQEAGGIKTIKLSEKEFYEKHNLTAAEIRDLMRWQLDLSKLALKGFGGLPNTQTKKYFIPILEKERINLFIELLEKHGYTEIEIPIHPEFMKSGFYILDTNKFIETISENAELFEEKGLLRRLENKQEADRYREELNKLVIPDKKGNYYVTAYNQLRKNHRNGTMEASTTPSLSNVSRKINEKLESKLNDKAMLFPATTTNREGKLWHISKGIELLYTEKWSEAIEEFDLIFKRFPLEINPVDERRALIGAGIASLKLADYERADEYFKLTLKQDKDNIEALLGSALTLYRREKYKESLARLEEILNKHPENFEAILGSAQIHYKLSQKLRGKHDRMTEEEKRELEKAAEYFNKAVSLHPYNRQAWHGLEKIYFRLNQENPNEANKTRFREASNRFEEISKLKTEEQLENEKLTNKIINRMLASIQGLVIRFPQKDLNKSLAEKLQILGFTEYYVETDEAGIVYAVIITDARGFNEFLKENMQSLLNEKFFVEVPAETAKELESMGFYIHEKNGKKYTFNIKQEYAAGISRTKIESTYEALKKKIRTQKEARNKNPENQTPQEIYLEGLSLIENEDVKNTLSNRENNLIQQISSNKKHSENFRNLIAPTIANITNINPELIPEITADKIYTITVDEKLSQRFADNPALSLQNPELLRESAVIALEAGNLEKAEQYLEELSSRHTLTVTAQAGLGYIYLTQGEHLKAEKIFSNLLDEKGLLGRGLTYLHMGREKEATHLLSQAGEKDARIKEAIKETQAINQQVLTELLKEKIIEALITEKTRKTDLFTKHHLKKENIDAELHKLIKEADRNKEKRAETLKSEWNTKHLPEGIEKATELLYEIDGILAEKEIPDLWTLDPLSSEGRKTIILHFQKTAEEFIKENKLEKYSEEIKTINLDIKPGNYRTVDLNDKTRKTQTYLKKVALTEEGKKTLEKTGKKISDSSSHRMAALYQGYAINHEEIEVINRRLTNYIGSTLDITTEEKPKEELINQYTSHLKNFSEAFPIIHSLKEISTITGKPVKELIPLLYLQPFFGLDPVDAETIAQVETILELEEKLSAEHNKPQTSLIEALSKINPQKITLPKKALTTYTQEKEIDEALSEFRKLIKQYGEQQLLGRTDLVNREELFRSLLTYTTKTGDTEITEKTREYITLIYTVIDGKTKGGVIHEMLELFEEICPG